MTAPFRRRRRTLGHAVAGLIDAGYLTVTTDGDAALADDVQYSRRAIETDDVNPY
jgi:hypothetical protein